MNSEAFGLSHFLASTDAVGLAVAAILAVMSVVSWTLILSKALHLRALRRRTDAWLGAFWRQPRADRQAPAVDDDAFAELPWRAARALGADRGADAASQAALERAIGRVVDGERARLQAGMTPLATIASSAPFVGLLGTVWGIRHALAVIGATGQATLDKVAGPVGEALVMTGFGLAVAIPAAIAYNAFGRAQRRRLASLQDFAHDLCDWLLAGLMPHRVPAVGGAASAKAGAAARPSEA